jgi:hypothetical protein
MGCRYITQMSTLIVVLAVLASLYIAVRLIMRHYFPPNT